MGVNTATGKVGHADCRGQLHLLYHSLECQQLWERTK